MHFSKPEAKKNWIEKKNTKTLNLLTVNTFKKKKKERDKKEEV